MFLWFGSKFFIFDHADSENLRYLAKTKKRCIKFFICCKVHKNVSENQQTVRKMLRETLIIFALDLKLDLGTETLILASAPKFLWLVVYSDNSFYFGMKQILCPKILIAGFGHS